MTRFGSVIECSCATRAALQVVAFIAVNFSFCVLSVGGALGADMHYFFAEPANSADGG
jgi:hypothetical protein